MNYEVRVAQQELFESGAEFALRVARSVIHTMIDLWCEREHARTKEQVAHANRCIGQQVRRIRESFRRSP